MKRDEFLLRTGCTRTILTLTVESAVPTLSLPETVIEAPRAYWLPEDDNDYPAPLQKTDEFAATAYQSMATISPADPIAFSSGMEPPLTVTLYPPPENLGQVEFITVQSQPLLSSSAPPSPTTFLLPPDFGPAIAWGALGYLMSISTEATDIPRAEIANARFDHFIELMSHYPFIFTGRNQNVPMYADAVETLDSYQPLWRVTSSLPSIIGISGQNLAALPTDQAQIITLYILASANLPTADDAPIQLGREVIDALTDYAQSILMFKVGGAECISAQELMKSILTLAAKRNAIIKSTSIYKDAMNSTSQRENEIEYQGVQKGDESG
jgi:hypothetical protein